MRNNYMKFFIKIGIIVMLFKGNVISYNVDVFISFVNLLFCYKVGLLK